MRDIVERLRHIEKWRGDTYSSYEVMGILGEAALEIERLRADRGRGHELLSWILEERDTEIERLRNELNAVHKLLTKWSNANEEALHEIERLRAAQKMMRDFMQHVAHRHSDEIHQLKSEIEQLRAALKAALNAASWGDQGDPQWAAQARRALESTANFDRK